MKSTYITDENVEYFEELAPKGLLRDENMFCLGGIANDGTACAVLITGIYEDTAYIEWIYTAPDYRRQRGARTLLELLKVLLKKISIKTILISFSDDCEDLEEFLEAEDFFADVDRENYSIPVMDLIYSPMLDRLQGRYTRDVGDTKIRVEKLFELEDPGKFYDYLKENRITLSDTEEESCSYSLVRMDREGKINGCMIICKYPKADIAVPYLISDGLTGGTLDLILAFKDLVTEREWQDERMIFSDRSGDAINVLEELLGENKENYVITGQKQALKILG